MHYEDDSIGQPNAHLVGTFDDTWGAFDTRTAALAYCLSVARTSNELLWITGDDPFFDPDYLEVFTELGMAHALSEDTDDSDPELPYQHQITDYDDDNFLYFA